MLQTSIDNQIPRSSSGLSSGRNITNAFAIPREMAPACPILIAMSPNVILKKNNVKKGWKKGETNYHLWLTCYTTSIDIAHGGELCDEVKPMQWLDCQ